MATRLIGACLSLVLSLDDHGTTVTSASEGDCIVDHHGLRWLGEAITYAYHQEGGWVLHHDVPFQEVPEAACRVLLIACFS